jgi:hypothetical protein
VSPKLFSFDDCLSTLEHCHLVEFYGAIVNAHAGKVRQFAERQSSGLTYGDKVHLPFVGVS